MIIKSLENTDLQSVINAFELAFADYDVHFGADRISAMLKRRGYNPALSFAAFDGDNIAAFTLNGVGTFNGIPTAYDTGTGTVKKYRGCGLASKIFEYSIPYLKSNGIEQYLLEVLQHNVKAISIYKKYGFKTTREFNCYACPNEKIDDTSAPLDIRIHPIALDTLAAASAFADFRPSWQNDEHSVQRAKENMVAFGAFDGNELAGYCITEPRYGDIAQIAVDTRRRRKGIGSALLYAAVKSNECDTIKIINTESSCSSITEFLNAHDIQLTSRQFEMVKRL